MFHGGYRKTGRDCLLGLHEFECGARRLRAHTDVSTSCKDRKGGAVRAVIACGSELRDKYAENKNSTVLNNTSPTVVVIASSDDEHRGDKAKSCIAFFGDCKRFENMNDHTK